jgi:4-hydroxy-L-threonine phosphate dehydrogenase PdxA
MGDINGIGPEVIIKALSNPMILKGITPVIYGSSKVLSYYKNILPELNFAYQQVPSPDKAQHSKINVINCWEEMVNITPGKATAEGGSYAFKALERATSDLKEKQLDCLVTAPINKEAMKMANFQYPGHTEYIESVIGGQSIMMMVSEDLKVGLVTNHLPIKDVTKSITKELIIQKINLLNQTLITDFDKEKPVIAVLGLNPHAGDNGAIGDDEDKIIRPAILELKKKGFFQKS